MSWDRMRGGERWDWERCCNRKVALHTHHLGCDIL